MTNICTALWGFDWRVAIPIMFHGPWKKKKQKTDVFVERTRLDDAATLTNTYLSFSLNSFVFPCRSELRY